MSAGAIGSGAGTVLAVELTGAGAAAGALVEAGVTDAGALVAVGAVGVPEVGSLVSMNGDKMRLFD